MNFDILRSGFANQTILMPSHMCGITTGGEVLVTILCREGPGGGGLVNLMGKI